MFHLVGVNRQHTGREEEEENEYPKANSRVHPKARFQFSPRTKAALAPRGREPVPNPANELQQRLSLSKQQYKNI
jgi:hypothetical protein